MCEDPDRSFLLTVTLFSFLRRATAGEVLAAVIMQRAFMEWRENRLQKKGVHRFWDVQEGEHFVRKIPLDPKVGGGRAAKVLRRIKTAQDALHAMNKDKDSATSLQSKMRSARIM
jgi:hypothetical protein